MVSDSHLIKLVEVISETYFLWWNISIFSTILCSKYPVHIHLNWKMKSFILDLKALKELYSSKNTLKNLSFKDAYHTEIVESKPVKCWNNSEIIPHLKTKDLKI